MDGPAVSGAKRSLSSCGAEPPPSSPFSLGSPMDWSLTTFSPETSTLRRISNRRDGRPRYCFAAAMFWRGSAHGLLQKACPFGGKIQVCRRGQTLGAHLAGCLA